MYANLVRSESMLSIKLHRLEKTQPTLDIKDSGTEVTPLSPRLERTPSTIANSAVIDASKEPTGAAVGVGNETSNSAASVTREVSELTSRLDNVTKEVERLATKPDWAQIREYLDQKGAIVSKDNKVTL